MKHLPSIGVLAPPHFPWKTSFSPVFDVRKSRCPLVKIATEHQSFIDRFSHENLHLSSGMFRCYDAMVDYPMIFPAIWCPNLVKIGLGRELALYSSTNGTLGKPSASETYKKLMLKITIEVSWIMLNYPFMTIVILNNLWHSQISIHEKFITIKPPFFPNFMKNNQHFHPQRKMTFRSTWNHEKSHELPWNPWFVDDWTSIKKNKQTT